MEVDDPRPRFFWDSRPMGRTRTRTTWGAIGLVVRNGRPYRLIREGQTAHNFWDPRLRGDLEVVPINTGTVMEEITVTNVKTRDEYAVRSLVLRYHCRLSRSNGYRDLLEYVIEAGPTFPESLVALMRATLTGLVHRTLAAHSHDELYGNHLTALLPGADGVRRLDGTPLELETLTAVGVVWDPAYLEERRVIAEGTSAINTIPTQQRLADLTGLSLADKLRPHERERRLQQEHELRVAILNNARDLGLRHDAGQRAAVTDMLGGDRRAGAVSSARSDEVGPRERQSLAASPVPVPGSGAPSAGSWSVNQRVAKVWTSAGGAAPVGAGIHTVADRAAVVLVLPRGAQHVPAPDDLRLLEAYRKRFRVAEVDVVVLQDGHPQDTVASWVRAVVGDALASVVDLRVAESPEDDEEVLVITLDSPGGEAAELHRRINRAGDPHLGALEHVLPHDDVRVDLHGLGG